jgi:3-oxoacyl-(acyl-carrier-protein) synthase
MARLHKATSDKFSVELVKKTVRTRRGEVEIEVYQAPETELPIEIPESIKRRMPRISKMALTSTMEAVNDAFGPNSRAVFEKNPERVGVIVGTAFGCLQVAIGYQSRVLTEGSAGASPTMFANSIQNAIASQLSIMLGAQGPNSTVTTMDQTTIGSLRLGYDWIQQDVVDHVIVTVGDELSECHHYAMTQFSANLENGLNPRSNSCSAVAGEGMASIVLSRSDRAQKKAYCTIDAIELHSPKCPEASRYVAAAYGAENQWVRYAKWIGREADTLCHAQHFGSFVTGSGLEVAIAANLVASDRRKTVCVQITDRDEVQTLTLS